MSENGKDRRERPEEITLESIMAEYKSEAYIQGQKKTPAKDLDEATRRIVEETLGRMPRIEIDVEPRRQEETWAAHDTPSIDPRFALDEDDTWSPASIYEEEEEPLLPYEEEESPLPYVAEEPLLPYHEEEEEEAPLYYEEEEEAPPLERFKPEPELEPEPEYEPEPEPMPPKRQKMEAGKVIHVDFPAIRAEEFQPKPLEEPKRKKWGRRKKDEDFEITETAFADDDPQVTAYTAYGDKEKQDRYGPLFDEEEEEEEEKRGLFGGLFRRSKREEEEDEDEYLDDDKPFDDREDWDEEEGKYDEEDLEEDDLNLREAAGKYGKGIGGYQIRAVGTIFIGLLMLLFTVLGDGGSGLFGLLRTDRGFAVFLLVGQLIAMLLTVEIVTTGILDVFRRRMGAETLAAVAALASLADAAMVLRGGAEERLLPYGAVAVLVLGFALLGMKATRNAMKNTLRTAATGSNPYTVTSKLDPIADAGFVLFKSRGDTAGFVKKTEQMDFSEHAYRLAAPLLLTGSLVFSLLAALVGVGEIGDALMYFAAMTLVSASFTGLLAYGLPYSILARKLSKIGAALAGWGGAAEVTSASKLIVTDADVFPVGTLSLSGVRVMQKTDTPRVIAYTGSLLAKSGSALGEVFLEVMRQQEIPTYPVADLVCHEGGGMVALVNGEEVTVGSASLMNLLGIRLPENLNVKNAVFTAMKGELAGVFAINYVPLSSVQEALVSLHQTKIQPLFAVRDFNVSPMMLQNKFHIATEKIDFLTYEDRFTLSAMAPDERARPFAVICREGLGPLTDVAVGGKRLKRAVFLNTILSLGSSVLGLLFLLSVFWTGLFESASAGNLFTYMGAWLFVICLLTQAVKFD